VTVDAVVRHVQLRADLPRVRITLERVPERERAVLRRESRRDVLGVRDEADGIRRRVRRRCALASIRCCCGDRKQDGLLIITFGMLLLRRGYADMSGFADRALSRERLAALLSRVGVTDYEYGRLFLGTYFRLVIRKAGSQLGQTPPAISN